MMTPEKEREQLFLKTNATNIRKAKTLLRNINSELSSIPQYKGMEKIGSPGAEPMNLSRSFGNAIIAIRRGLRSLRGAESVASLAAKKDNLTRYLKEAESMQSSLPPGPNSLTSRRSAKDAPKIPKM